MRHTWRRKADGTTSSIARSLTCCKTTPRIVLLVPFRSFLPLFAVFFSHSLSYRGSAANGPAVAQSSIALSCGSEDGDCDRDRLTTMRVVKELVVVVLLLLLLPPPLPPLLPLLLLPLLPLKS